MFRLFILVTVFVILSKFSFSQLSYVKHEIDIPSVSYNNESFIAYKLPYRGNNYKFYGAMNYHIFGKAFAGCKVHNAIVESFHMSEENCPNVNFKLLKSSKHKFGRLKLQKEYNSGYYCYFITPMKKNNLPVKQNYKTGIFRKTSGFNSKGELKTNKNICIDFESMAQYLLNLDSSAKMYGLEIKKIVFNRLYLKELYNTKAGKELKKRDMYFAKYLSEKVNRKFDNIFYVEFKKSRIK